MIVVFSFSATSVFATDLELNNSNIYEEAKVIDSPDIPEILTDAQVEELMRLDDGQFQFTEFNDGSIKPSINRDGSFSFYFGTALSSNQFSLINNLTSTRINVTSKLVGDGGSNRSTFSITLYSKNGILWKNEGTREFTVGRSQAAGWSSLPLHGTFYLYFRTPNVASPGKYIKGNGTISNFGSVK